MTAVCSLRNQISLKRSNTFYGNTTRNKQTPNKETKTHLIKIWGKEKTNQSIKFYGRREDNSFAQSCEQREDNSLHYITGKEKITHFRKYYGNPPTPPGFLFVLLLLLFFKLRVLKLMIMRIVLRFAPPFSYKYATF